MCLDDLIEERNAKIGRQLNPEIWEIDLSEDLSGMSIH